MTNKGLVIYDGEEGLQNRRTGGAGGGGKLSFTSTSTKRGIEKVLSRLKG